MLMIKTKHSRLSINLKLMDVLSPSKFLNQPKEITTKTDQEISTKTDQEISTKIDQEISTTITIKIDQEITTTTKTDQEITTKTAKSPPTWSMSPICHFQLMTMHLQESSKDSLFPKLMSPEKEMDSAEDMDL
jgi:hypothetical protein